MYILSTLLLQIGRRLSFQNIVLQTVGRVQKGSKSEDKDLAVYAMKAYMGGRGIAPLIHNPSTRWS